MIELDRSQPAGRPSLGVLTRAMGRPQTRGQSSTRRHRQRLQRQSGPHRPPERGGPNGLPRRRAALWTPPREGGRAPGAARAAQSSWSPLGSVNRSQTPRPGPQRPPCDARRGTGGAEAPEANLGKSGMVVAAVEQRSRRTRATGDPGPARETTPGVGPAGLRRRPVNLRKLRSDPSQPLRPRPRRQQPPFSQPLPPPRRPASSPP